MWRDVKRCEENVKRSLHILFTSLHISSHARMTNRYLSRNPIYESFILLQIWILREILLRYSWAGYPPQILGFVLPSDLGIAEVGLHFMKSSPSKPGNPQTFDSNPTYSEEIVGRVFLALFPNNLDINLCREENLKWFEFLIMILESIKVGKIGICQIAKGFT